MGSVQTRAATIAAKPEGVAQAAEYAARQAAERAERFAADEKGAVRLPGGGKPAQPAAAAEEAAKAGKPASAAQFQENIDRSELGPRLGKGGNKDVYAYRDNEAVGVMRDGDLSKSTANIEKEMRDLRTLEEAGIPTVKARGPVKVGDKAGVVYERFEQGSKDVVRLRRQ